MYRLVRNSYFWPVFGEVCDLTTADEWSYSRMKRYLTAAVLATSLMSLSEAAPSTNFQVNLLGDSNMGSPSLTHAEKNYQASVKVYSMLGKEVLTLGKNTTYFEATKACSQNLPSGRYVINIRANGTDRSSIINVR